MAVGDYSKVRKFPQCHPHTWLTLGGGYNNKTSLDR